MCAALRGTPESGRWESRLSAATIVFVAYSFDLRSELHALWHDALRRSLYASQVAYERTNTGHEAAQMTCCDAAQGCGSSDCGGSYKRTCVAGLSFD